jgi:hypothetical protein
VPDTCRPSFSSAGPPRNQLEAETVVDHGEAAGRQRDSLSIGARNVFAVGGGMVRQAGLG